MRPSRLATLAVIFAAVVGPLGGRAVAQTAAPDQGPALVERNLSGPRLGITYVGINAPRLVSQFGWHFEWQVIPEGGGPQFVIQLVPLVAGVEHGRFMPSLTLAMGVRFPSGIEGGLGPNLQLVDPVSTGLVLGIGKSFDYGGVSIPVNLAYTINPMGNRVSVIIGYAIQRSSSRRARRATGDVDGSIRELREAVRLRPEDADAHYFLGVALEEKGALRAALKEYRVAVSLDPNDAEFRRGYEELSRKLKR